jgi:CHAT domain-containing protein/tetratricopeptide (TPR) repeat protein
VDLQRGLNLARSARDYAAVSMFLTALGTALGHLAEYAGALQSFQAALRIDQQMNGGSLWAADYANIGRAELGLGRYADALASEQSARALARDYNYCDAEAAALGVLGSVQSALGQYDEALRSLDSALAIDQQLGDRSSEASDLVSIGIAQQLLGHYSEALSSEQAALALKDSGENAFALGNIGMIQAQLGRPRDALRSLQGALALLRRSGNRYGQAAALTNIAYVEQQTGKHAAALDTGQQALQLMRRHGSPTWETLAVVAAASASLDRVADATRDYDAAISEIEVARSTIPEPGVRASFFTRALPVYDDYTNYLIELNRRVPGHGYDAKAFTVFEKRQARVFLEEIAQSAARKFSGIPPGLIDKERTLAAQIGLHGSNVASFAANHEIYGGTTSSWEKLERASLSEAVQQQAALRALVRRKYPAYYQLQHPRLLDARTLQRSVLRQHEAIVVYDVLSRVTALWVITPSLPLRLLVLPCGTSTVQAKVTAFLAPSQSLQKVISQGLSPNAVQRQAAGTLPEFVHASAGLYAWLFPAAARSMIANAGTLFIVPTDALYRVPFEALVTKVPPVAATPHYLIADHAISYLSSASVLGVLRFERHRRPAPKPLLAFAPVTFGDANYASLPGSENEVASVAAILHASSSDLYLRARASVAAVNRLNGNGDSNNRLRDYRSVLFATHAVMPDPGQNSVTPSLVLASSDAGGNLTMGDVFGLSLNANLVTLSACHSGGGVATKGEGIQGLTGAFMYAGTPVVSVTQWDVVDEVAQRFTPAFFARLKQNSPAQALRQTKLDMIDGRLRSGDPLAPSWSNPFFWAPTILFGDGGSTSGSRS